MSLINFEEKLKILIDAALLEDVGAGDFSTLSTIDAQQRGKAILKVKQDGILAGVDVAKAIFKHVETDVIFHPLMKDGDVMKVGNVAFEIEALTHTILTCERLVLNSMQRMSGIATITRTYADALAGYHTQLLDTRKTTPNFRLLEKEAVRIGGGQNHRMGLYDMIMLKDNHIDFCGGITKAVEKVRNYLQKEKLDLKVEVETRSLTDVKEALATGGVDRIMLDNFLPAKITEALLIIKGACETEASGGINLENLKQYAETGVDFISSGAVIHQAVSLDLSLKAVSR